MSAKECPPELKHCINGPQPLLTSAGHCASSGL